MYTTTDMQSTVLDVSGCSVYSVLTSWANRCILHVTVWIIGMQSEKQWIQVNSNKMEKRHQKGIRVSVVLVKDCHQMQLIAWQSFFGTTLTPCLSVIMRHINPSWSVLHLASLSKGTMWTLVATPLNPLSPPLPSLCTALTNVCI